MSLDFQVPAQVIEVPKFLLSLRVLLASDSLRKLRSSMLGVVWSRRQPLAGVGAVLLSVLFGSGFGYCAGISLFLAYGGW